MRIAFFAALAVAASAVRLQTYEEMPEAVDLAEIETDTQADKSLPVPQKTA